MRSIRLYILSIFLTLSSVFAPVYAQYTAAKVTTDPKTEAEMVALYTLENGFEALRKSYYLDIAKHYKSGSLASAGILFSKQQDRKAMLEIGIFGQEEFGYYQRILSVVTNMIMPKVVTVAMLMLDYPTEALLWGSYLYRILQEVKNLCMFFECVVTNGSLSFRGVDFLRVSDEFKVFFDLAKLGSLDWKKIFDGLTNVKSFPTKEEILEDLASIVGQAKSIATAGFGHYADMWSTIAHTDFTDLNFDKIWLLYDTYTEATQLLDDVRHIDSIIKTRLGALTKPEALARILTLDSYNITEWISDYLHQAIGRYYRQRYYIYSSDTGSQTVFTYTPSTRNQSVSSEWVRYLNNFDDYTPSTSQLNTIKSNSESFCGWSKNKVDDLNKADPTYKYEIQYTLYHSVLRKGYGYKYTHCFAYGITVTKSWNIEKVVYEEVYDSENMSLAAFMANLQSLLQSYNENEEGITYAIGYDPKVYYELADKERVSGSESVNFVVNCHDDTPLAKGGNQWKEDAHINSGSLNERCKQYAMASTLPSSPDYSTFDSQISTLESQIATIDGELTSLQNRSNELLELISSSRPEDQAAYRNEYNAIQTRMKSLRSQKTTLQNELTDVQTARDELENDYSGASDSYARIPAFQHECESELGVTWTDVGGWEGYTFIRHGVMGSSNTPVTFVCDYKMVRAERFFLGVRIHRARLALEWRLEANLSTSDVVDVMKIDPSLSDKENQALVNDRLREIQDEYPSCSVELEYNHQTQVEDSLDDDKWHLLWQSDRLTIAREVELRLRTIYSQLLLIEKFMSSRRTIKDMLKWELRKVVHYVDNEALGDAHRRWMDSAGKGSKVKVASSSSSGTSP